MFYYKDFNSMLVIRGNRGISLSSDSILREFMKKTFGVTTSKAWLGSQKRPTSEQFRDSTTDRTFLRKDAIADVRVG